MPSATRLQHRRSSERPKQCFRLRRDYLKAHRPFQYTNLITEGTLWTYLVDPNEQAQERLVRIIGQMKESEGVTETLNTTD